MKYMFLSNTQCENVLVPLVLISVVYFHSHLDCLAHQVEYKHKIVQLLLLVSLEHKYEEHKDIFCYSSITMSKSKMYQNKLQKIENGCKKYSRQSIGS